jgi:hypothetical protein
MKGSAGCIASHKVCLQSPWESEDGASEQLPGLMQESRSTHAAGGAWSLGQILVVFRVF